MTHLISSENQTKEWRQNQNWYSNGKSNECEKYQKTIIEKAFKINISKTQERLNIHTFEIQEKNNFLSKNDGFDWTENFDGKFILNNKIFYFNFKFVCENGGAQVRSLREVYYFIIYQFKFLQKIKKNNIFFINILDGKFCHDNVNKFQKLQKEYCNSNVFIGDSNEFVKSNFLQQHLNYKKENGQFFTTNSDYILQNLKLPDNMTIIEPFAGNGDLINYVEKNIKNPIIFAYDKEITNNNYNIIKKDTLLEPLNYDNCYIVTNPPYLARNKSKNKIIFNKFNQNDLYKCFIHQLNQSNNLLGGILILPLNFFSSVRISDIQLRQNFLEKYYIGKVNVFEERVFEDTSCAVCSFNFFKKEQKEQNTQEFITFNFYPSTKIMNIPIINYIIGYEIYNLSLSEYSITRATTKNKNKHNFITNINVKCIDDTQNIHFFYDTNHIIDNTVNLSNRTYASLIIEPFIDENRQKEIIEKANNFLTEKRNKYNSLFLPTYREYTRKRICFDLIYKIISHVLL